MKNRVIVFTGNQNFCTRKIEDALLNLGHFDFSYIICHTQTDCEGECGQDFDKAIVICENQYLDGLLENIKKEGDSFTLLHEQAVLMEHKNDGNVEKRILFLPFEVDYQMFLKEFLENQSPLVFSVFGKTLGYIENIFNSIRCDYKIITKSPILHTIYCSSSVNPELLKNAFAENLYSSENESVASTCSQFLKKNGLSVAIAEQVTSGLVCGALNSLSPVVKECHVLLSNEDFQKLSISQEFLSEHGLASKETAFEVAKNLMNSAKTDLTMAVLGDNEKFFVAVGNKQQIHVFSTTFSGDFYQVLNNVVDFALFRLLCVCK